VRNGDAVDGSVSDLVIIQSTSNPSDVAQSCKEKVWFTRDLLFVLSFIIL
jgi:hypothetical protein